MDVITSAEIRSQEEVALANLYANQHERLDNFIFMYAIPARYFKKHGIEIHSGRGYFLFFSIFFLVIFIPGVIIAALSLGWAELSALNLALVAATLAILNVVVLIIAQTAAYKISALHRLLRYADQIRALMKWDRRWFSPKTSALMSSIIALAFLIILYILNLSVKGEKLSLLTLWVCAVITILLGQFSFSTIMVFFEFKKLATCSFELYKLNPYDTHSIQTTCTGLKQLGLASTVSLPFFLLILLLVMPEGSALNIPITAGFLLMAYIVIAIGILYPLKFLGDIIKAEKWRMLSPLQSELTQMANRIQTLSKDDYDHFIRLQMLYQAIRDAKDSFLSLSSVARIAGASLISTISVVLPSIIQKYL
jgi:hypothetical protein